MFSENRNFLIIILILMFVGFLLQTRKSDMYVPDTNTDTRENILLESQNEATTTPESETGEEPSTENATRENTVQKQIEDAISSLLKEPNIAVKTPVVNAPVVTAPVVEAVDPGISFSLINEQARESLVNILCTTKSGGLLNPISGSGIIIDPKGIILTNSHVAQYYLLKDYSTTDFITCVIRTGSPAKVKYLAEPLYISESWIGENAKLIDAQEALGTGEYDYALLMITKTIDGSPLPENFAYTKISKSTNLKINDNVYLGGYPAGFIGGITIQKSLSITSTIGQISELFTFGEGALDLIGVKGSIVSQKGSSGGAVINNKGDLIGVVVTSTSADNTADRILGAITTGYVERDFERQVGTSLEDFLSRSNETTIESFWSTIAPPLIEALENELDN